MIAIKTSNLGGGREDPQRRGHALTAASLPSCEVTYRALSDSGMVEFRGLFDNLVTPSLHMLDNDF
jgi:hypothetical protein